MVAFIKISTLLGWAVILFNWAMPIEGMYTLLHYSGIGLACAHTLEMLIYTPMIKKAPGTKSLHYLQVFTFGVGHFLVLKELTKDK